MSYQWNNKGILKSQNADIAKIKELLVRAEFTPDYFISMMTEQIEFTDNLEELSGLNKLIELRAFNQVEELLLWRNTVGEDLHYRIARDSEWSPDMSDELRFMDEQHMLDIDDTRTKSDGSTTKVVTTGGGRYILPFSGAHSHQTKVKIRNFLGYYEETGQVYLADWRVVDFLKGGE